MVESPQRIWIEADDECPYFYEEDELHEVGQAVIEYTRSDLVAELEADNERLRKVLSNLLAPFADDECRKDHHGYCQAHFLEEDCCVAAARRALEGGNDD